MKIVFGSAELARNCNVDEERLRAYGPDLADILRRRLSQMAAAASLAELRSVPATRLRLDSERNDGRWLVALGQRADLRVRPYEESLPTRDDGQPDETRIRELLVYEVAIT